MKGVCVVGGGCQAGHYALMMLDQCEYEKTILYYISLTCGVMLCIAPVAGRHAMTGLSRLAKPATAAGHQKGPADE